ncbi:MAG: ferritin [Candidatus Micrarchaeota archaeon]
MEISKGLEKTMNEQINHEFSSSYIYLSMCAYFEREGLNGFAGWMEKQSDEEVEHGMKFFKFIHERGGKVTLSAIPAPKTEWKSALEAFEDAYKHEVKVTALIHALKDGAQSEKDHASDEFLDWFTSEQVEEEKQTSEIVQKLRMVGDSKHALLALDAELGKRKGGKE